MDGDRKKTEAARVLASPPPEQPPNTLTRPSSPPPPTADKHMWADNIERERKRERKREGGPGASEALTSSALTADGGRLGSCTHITVKHLLYTPLPNPHTHTHPSLHIQIHARAPLHYSPSLAVFSLHRKSSPHLPTFTPLTPLHTLLQQC